MCCCSVAAATKRSFEDVSNIRVQPFGSFVNGLSTWNSDVDLVVTGGVFLCDKLTWSCEIVAC
jgi:non-canonical poly(A) RNA polymerase PAPD5/7